MAKCKKIDREIINICLADLNRKIIVKSRVLTPSGVGSVDYSETFATVTTLWALVKTLDMRGREEFDGTQLRSEARFSATHDMYVRYTANVTQENFIEYNNEYYDILEVTNLNEDSTFLHLKCSLRGLNTNNINLA